MDEQLKESAFGPVPPDDKDLIFNFLEDRFLIISPNSYNLLGAGTTQLYNTKYVYNHKISAIIQLGNKKFEFIQKDNFPDTVTMTYLCIDMLNNIDRLAEDIPIVTKRLLDKIKSNYDNMVGEIELYATEKSKNLINTYVKKNL